MGKMTVVGGDTSGGSSRQGLKSGLEAGQLRFWKSMEKGLEEDDSLAQAGVEIVVYSVEQFPIAFRLKGLADGEFFHGGLEAGIKFLDKIGESRDFVKELRLAREEDFAEEVIEVGDTLTPGILKILGVERREIRSGAEVLGMLEHGAEQGVKRLGQSLAKSRSNPKDLIGLGIAPTTAHA
jgi:hypothetical protein